MKSRLKQANVANVSQLVLELRFHLARPGLHNGKADKALRTAATSISQDFRDGRTAFGKMAQLVVDAVSRHAQTALASSNDIRASDVRIARALTCYLDEEIRILAEVFGDRLPGYIGYDMDCCREMLVWDLETGLQIFEADGPDGIEYRWTSLTRELLLGPRPIKPDETRLLRTDFDDLFVRR